MSIDREPESTVKQYNRILCSSKNHGKISFVLRQKALQNKLLSEKSEVYSMLYYVQGGNETTYVYWVISV